MSGDPSLVVASHRLPYTFHTGSGGVERRRSTGGLVSTLEPALQKRGGTWIGWPGGPVPGEAAADGPGAPFRTVPLALGNKAARDHDRLAHGVLWPLFHSMPGRASYDPRQWKAYRAVNERFAASLLRESRPDSILWVHDYPLMLVPEQVRRARPERALLFFLHVPFPPHDLFTLVPHHEELLRGVLGSRLVGLNTPAYVTNLLDCAERCLGADVDREAGVVELEGRAVRVGAFPIGIDQAAFEGLALAAPDTPHRERIVLGADRLDYTKGIPERIEAVGRLLDRYPGYRESVTLVQVTVPSRADVPGYPELKGEIDEAVGRVNGRLATDRWSPIRYLSHALHPRELAGLYRDAEVGLVTSLRDGMNLVAKEFVACRVKEPGVLVLSRQAGAAHEMPEALIVNPYDIDETADALRRALEMPAAERRRRMEALRRREAAHDVHAWVASLLSAMMEAPHA